MEGALTLTLTLTLTRTLTLTLTLTITLTLNQLHAADFAAQGYPTLETSPRLMFDRASYLFEAQAQRAALTLPQSQGLG